MTRNLTGADRPAILVAFEASADHVLAKRGKAPGPHLVDDYFTGASPGPLGTDRGSAGRWRTKASPMVGKPQTVHRRVKPV